MDVFELIEQTLAFTYYHGVYQKHFDAHHTPAGTWRTLPWLAMVHADETDYHFIVQETGTDYLARKDEIVFVPANMPHRLNQPKPGIHCSAHFQYRILGALDPLSLFNVPYYFNRKETNVIKDDLFFLINSYKDPAKNLSTVLQRKESAFRLLRHILDRSKIKKERAALLNRFSRIQAVLDYIENNLGGQITRDYLAEIASLSPARFNYLFREIMGMPPKQYVQNQRQKRALELLREENLTIEQIAERLGYCDQFHFSRQFKKILGVNPSAYRAALKKQEWVFLGS